MKTIAIISAAALIIALLIIFLLWPIARTARPNVLWITMDSLRYDHLHCMGYERPISPNIDTLARQGALFRQCIAQANYTNISVPSMVTSIYPVFLDVRTPLQNLDDLFVTLAERLTDAGYATSAVLPDWPVGMNQGFERVEVLDGNTDKRTRAFLDILTSLDDRPFFIWLYYWDPHAPYQPPEKFAELLGVEQTFPEAPEGVRHSSEDLARWQRSVRGRQGWEQMKTLARINEGSLSPAPGYGQHLMNLYDAEILYVDDRLGQVFEAIKKKDLWNRTLVILDADHGEEFGEHGLFFHGYGLYEEEVRVPLIIKPPRSMSSPRTVETAVRNLDIVPTVLDYCHLSIPEGINGCSLRSGIEGGGLEDLPAAMESNTPKKGVHMAGYRQGGFKVIYHLGEPVELFDLTEDPHERANLLSGAEETALRKEEQLRRELLALYGVDRVEDLFYTRRKRTIDPQNLEKLKALGYVY